MIGDPYRALNDAPRDREIRVYLGCGPEEGRRWAEARWVDGKGWTYATTGVPIGEWWDNFPTKWRLSPSLSSTK